MVRKVCDTRLACVDVTALPLQVLLQQHRHWQRQPVAVVDRDSANGRILWLNAQAQRAGVRPGMRYAAALAITHNLQADTVSDADITTGVGRIQERLWCYSPGVEPLAVPGVRHMVGSFWLNAGGLERVYPSLRTWGRALADGLMSIGYTSAIVAGFRRFETYALARSGKRLQVFDDLPAERQAAQRLPLDRVLSEPKLLAVLRKLQINQVGAFQQLSETAVRQRFGETAVAWHRFACGVMEVPLHPVEPPQPMLITHRFDDPIRDRRAVELVITHCLPELLERVKAAHAAVAVLAVHLYSDTAGAAPLSTELRPAEPTVDTERLLLLLSLRLASLAIEFAVQELVLDVETVPLPTGQLDLWDLHPTREPAAADNALALLRAKFGDAAVMRACAAEAHLPSAAYRWEPLRQLVRPQPSFSGSRQLVRRIYTPPLRLDARPGEPLPLIGNAPVGRLGGPFVISGGWCETTWHYDYYFVETRQGRVCWIYLDHMRDMWFLQGEVG